MLKPLRTSSEGDTLITNLQSFQLKGSYSILGTSRCLIHTQTQYVRMLSNIDILKNKAHYHSAIRLIINLMIKLMTVRETGVDNRQYTKRAEISYKCTGEWILNKD